jgi:flagellar L-ring protein precursor FlgH
MMCFGVLVVIAASVAGCSSDGGGFLREPPLSPLGAGLGGGLESSSAELLARVHSRNGWEDRHAYPELFRDRKIGRKGDIVTVNIAVNDKATFGNTTDRELTGKNSLSGDLSLHFGANSNPSNVALNTASSTSTQGKGNIDRSEKIQVSVAAMVTDVLPNGYLVISGSQEVRVNFELRQVFVAGIASPSDISQNNVVSYDRLAEARVSYGGSGRISELQKPAWGQTLFEQIKPF